MLISIGGYVALTGYYSQNPLLTEEKLSSILEIKKMI